MLKNEGYINAHVGKWHLGEKGNYPMDQGFDVNIGGWESGGPKGGYFSPYSNLIWKMVLRVNTLQTD